MTIRAFLLAICLILQTPFCLAASSLAPSNKMNVIIDTDMAIDDWLAMVFLAQHPKVNILAITVTGAGEASCEDGMRNAARIMALTFQPNVPITCGRPGPLAGGKTLFPALWQKQVNSLLDIPLPAAKGNFPKEHAVETLQRLIEHTKEPVSILALGPLTNLADWFDRYPKSAKKVHQLYAMAGAFYVPGNVRDSTLEEGKPIKNTVAEWNVYADPLAFKKVLASGVSLTLIPLNATNQVPLDQDIYDRLKAERRTKVADFVFEVFTKDGTFRRPEGWFFWDPLAAAIMVEEDLAKFQKMDIDVVVSPSDLAGMTYESVDAHPVRVAMDAWDQGFDNDFIEILNRTE